MTDNLYTHMEKYLLLIAEGPRLGVQFAETFFGLKEFENIKHGNGIPTLVIPGFSVGNSSTFFLRKVLEQKGHNMQKWCQNKNNGFSAQVISETLDQTKQLAEKYQTRINLVGQSLGGCFARIVANKIPDYINNVVTLGSPINGIDRVSKHMLDSYDLIAGFANAAFIHHGSFKNTFLGNPPVPTSSVYSKSDGIVHWEHSLIEETQISENIEIESSHLAMGFQLLVFQILADRLIQEKQNWEKWNKSIN